MGGKNGESFLLGQVVGGMGLLTRNVEGRAEREEGEGVGRLGLIVLSRCSSVCCIFSYCSVRACGNVLKHF